VVEVVEIRTLSGALSGAVLTLGEVVAFHIDERFLVAGRFDTARASPLARKAAAISDRAAEREIAEKVRAKASSCGGTYVRDLRAPHVGPARARAVRRMRPGLLFS
jgi:hypothetical protein